MPEQVPRLPDPNAFEREVTTDLKDTTPDRPKGLPLHTRILIGLGVGIAAGLAVNQLLGVAGRLRELEERGELESSVGRWLAGFDKADVEWVIENVTDPLGTLFLRLLLMTVVPLVFSSLVVGVAGIGDIRKLGRIGLKSFAYTIVVSAISVVIGLTLANTLRPGERLSEATKAELRERYQSDAAKLEAARKKAEEAAKDSPLLQAVKMIVPANPMASITGEAPSWTPNMLQLMFFALLIGIAATLVRREAIEPFLNALQGLFDVTAKIIDMVMRLAPYAVACLLFTNTARFGLDLLGALVWFMAAVLLGLAIHMFGVYSLSVYFLSRISPWDFFRRIKTVMLTAFSTSSSNATLPTALRVTEENLGVPRAINSFVLTVGATANQNGTALYEGVTVLFIAQLAGVELNLGQQLMVVYLAILGGIGTAGVPAGSIPFIVGVVAMLGIDPMMVAVILGVDRILDMCRTTLNVTGDITIATYVTRSEGYALLGQTK